MAFHVRNAATEAKVREYARWRGVGVTEAVRLAVDEALVRRDQDVAAKLARMRGISDRIANAPPTGERADKAFFDELSGDEG